MQLNQQLVEKKVTREDGSLAVNSIFYTIQGEGPFAGKPAVFIRLAGCNLQCPMCDTEYTNRALLDFAEIEHIVKNKFVRSEDKGYLGINDFLVVITGGEPFRQNIIPLVKKLIDSGYTVQIETNGTMWQEIHPSAHIVCSPKTGSVHPKIEERARAYKYVLDSSSVADDGLPILALGHPNSGLLARPPAYRRDLLIYVQPADEKNEFLNRKNLQVVKDSAMFFGYTLCIQTHKIIGVN